MIDDLIEDVKKDFVVCQKDKRVFKIKIEKEKLIDSLNILIQKGFITLTQISCADWIEDSVFSLNYILTNKTRALNLMVEVDVPRDISDIISAKDIFAQALVMERDIHEMFGIDFKGNDTLYDFALEDWEGIPPLRREFDTLQFVNENYEFKKGREDNKDVKAELKRRKAQAKKKADELKALKEKEAKKNEEQADGTK
ncbi:MAG: NADH-quinone oxidoreductase subunit C [Campylobacterota bacterium]|nr:NADH-quinone oxidoreductase subunit C [Campylobacterota bacterium]